MSTIQSSSEYIQISASNIGGIDETSVELTSGVNILTGRNATNRTSFIQAIMAGLGSDRVSLKGDADSGRVELVVGDETYTRELKRTNGTVTATGDPYLDDPELADLFAFLLESNEARRAVAQGGDLRELIMRPVDTDAIQVEIEDLKSERRRIDDRLDEIRSIKERLPKLEQRQAELESKIEEKKAQLDEKETQLQEADTDVDEKRDEKARLEQRLDDLNETRSELEDVRFQLETTRESLASLREEREDFSADLDDVADTPAGELAEVEDRIGSLRDEKRELDSVVNKLQNLIRFNQDMLEGDDELLQILAQLHGHDEEDSSVTDRLLTESETMACWTCGSDVQKTRIQETIDRLREISQEKRSERTAITDELDELKSRRRDLEREQETRERLERKLDQLDDEIERREENREQLEAERESLTSEIERLEEQVSELEDADYSAVLDKHREVNQLEFEIDRLQDEAASVSEEIEDLEQETGREEELTERREEIGDDLGELRTRIDRLEEEAVTAFNEHMDSILDLLGYDNLDRIWIERTETTIREGRRKVPKTEFRLHVIRSNEAGSSYEDTVDHLSESEREVTGLVFALAGYLVHEVHEVVSFMLLDSLEAIDSERIATLIDYFKQYASYLVVALLPEDAAALDSEYRRVTKI
ncbi:MAG: archaea-specific SMC-related protein [Salinigranum sp.]